VVERRRTILPVRRRRDARGASAVEFALVMPLLFALLFASVTFGFLFLHYVSLNDSVRAGARFGGTVLYDANWSTKVVNRTVEYSAGSLTASQVCVALVRGPSSIPVQSSTCSLTGAAATPPVTPAGVAPLDCVVKVWAAEPETLSAPPLFSRSVTLHRGSVSRYERTC